MRLNLARKRLRVIFVESSMLLKNRFRLEVGWEIERENQIAVRVDQLGVTDHRLAKMADRLFDSSDIDGHFAMIESCFGQRRIELDCLFARIDCLIQFPFPCNAAPRLL